MIFNLKRYITPTWYFNLKPAKDFAYFPTPKQVEDAGVKIDVDPNYTSEEARQRDVAFRAFQMGLISKEREAVAGLDVWTKAKIPVVDEYRYLRKNFHPVSVLYTLMLRLFSFKNPFAEISGYLGSKKHGKKESFAQNHVPYKDFETRECPLLEEAPFITVVIPTLNRYEYLKDVLIDLEKQTYKNFEVIVVDQSEPYKADFYEGWNLDLKAFYQEEKALWKARNHAITEAKGEYILLYDDDSLVDENWIEMHIRCLDYFNADISSGVSISKVGDEVPEHYSYFRWSDQLDTGNVLLKKDIFKKIGLFDVNFEKQRMGDGEYGLRSYLAGYRNVSNPLAKRIHLKVGVGGLRQMGSWDAFRTQKFSQPRPIPSVLYLFRKYHGFGASVISLFINVPRGIVPYKFKKSKKLRIVGAFLSVVIFPLILIQVAKSWRRSSKMLLRTDTIKLLG